MLSLPTAHCAVCITDVERELQRHEGVRSARVNLTLKRVSIEAEPGVSAEDLIGRLDRIGYEAHELDPGLLSATEADKRGRDILMRIGVAGFAMMNIMLLSIAVWAGAESTTRDLFHWISAASCAADGDFCRSAVLCQRLELAEGRAAGDGCADLVGDPAGLGHLGL